MKAAPGVQARQQGTTGEGPRESAGGENSVVPTSKAHLKGSARPCRGGGLPSRSLRPLVAACRSYSCSRAPLPRAGVEGLGLRRRSPILQARGPSRAFYRDLKRAGSGVSQDWNLGLGDTSFN